MPTPRVLPLMIALASLGTATGGFVAAADLRADERRERALAAQRLAEQREREAVAAYQQAVTPVATELYDLVQPLQQSYADLQDGVVSAVDVLIDVSAYVVGEQGLPALSSRLEAVVPAESVREGHEQLEGALQEMAAAARPVAALADDTEDTVDADRIAEGDLGLDAATRDWTAALTRAFAGAAPPPAPVEAGVAGVRPALSPTSYLREAGNLCSAGLDALMEAGNDKPDRSVEEARQTLQELSGRIPQLTAVKVVPADEKRVADSIGEPLQRTLELSAGFESAVAAARRGDRPGLQAAQAQIARGEIAAEKAAAGFRAYGSQLCALYLVGLEDEAGADAGEDTRTT